MSMVHCRACGKEIHETAPLCPGCGAPQHMTLNVVNLKSQTTAGLWCAFLGGFGAHRFYLGKVVSGIFYLLFFWTSIPALFAFVELIIIAFTGQQAWATKYNGGRITPSAHWTLKALALAGPILFAVGVLAAIAIPAYQDYTTRVHATQFR